MIEHVPKTLYENRVFIPYFSVLIIFAGAFSYLGSIVGGSLVIPYDFPEFFAVFPFLLVFSFLFTEFSSRISSSLGHKTYFTSEERVKRALKVFILFSVLSLLYKFSLLLSFFIWFLIIYAAVSISVDGKGFFTSLMDAIEVFKKPLPVFELFTLIFISYSVLVPIDVYGGFFGSIAAVLLSALVLTPAVIAHATLTYLRKYPLVLKPLGQ